MTVRVAVVGAGRFGLEHLRTYAEMPGVSISAVVDSDLERATATARAFGAVSFSSVEAMFAASEPEAVSVAVPAGLRGSTVIDLVARGVGVLIEKPLAPNIAEAERARDAAVGRPVMVGHLVRFAEPYLQIWQRLQEGAFGGVKVIRVSRTRAENHFDDFPGESLIRLTMIHDLDLVSWLTQNRRIAGVSARVGRREDGRIQWCEASVRVADGPDVIVEGAWEGGVTDEIDVLEVSGTESSASMTLDATGSDSHFDGVHHLGPHSGAIYAEALHRELVHFIESVRNGQPSERLRMDDAVIAVSLAQAVEKSVDMGGGYVPLAHHEPVSPVLASKAGLPFVQEGEVAHGNR